jgi:hypothetical protein
MRFRGFLAIAKLRPPSATPTSRPRRFLKQATQQVLPLGIWLVHCQGRECPFRQREVRSNNSAIVSYLFFDIIKLWQFGQSQR